MFLELITDGLFKLALYSKYGNIGDKDMQAQSITENIIKIVKGNVYNNLMGLFSAFANNARKLDEV